MGHHIAAGDIVDLTAIQDRTGASMRAIVSQWWPHPDFPQPMKVFPEGPIWYWPSIVAWLERTGEVQPRCNPTPDN